MKDELEGLRKATDDLKATLDKRRGDDAERFLGGGKREFKPKPHAPSDAARFRVARRTTG